MTCPVCQTPSPSFLDTQLQCRTFHCPRCELIFKPQECHPTVEAELKKYGEHRNSLDNEGYVAMFERFIDFVLSYTAAETSRVLDFGSGPTPVLAELLRRRGFDVAIYDKHYAPRPLPPDDRFDLITSTEVIEHIAEPLSTLRELKSRLSPGGTLALMTQFHRNDRDAYLQWWYRRDPTHLCFFTPATFGVIAEILGMEVAAHDGRSTLLLRLS